MRTKYWGVNVVEAREAERDSLLVFVIARIAKIVLALCPERKENSR